ncbi:MAG TPA: MMPL family transporter [Solirubrobacteraceae bacterium]|nr:MMPL family transporter [Solirubrobacteraceae bacterium]
MSLAALGRFAVRRRRLVLAGAVVFTLLASAIAGSVVERLSSGGFDVPGSESAVAAKALEHRFGVRAPNLVLLVRSSRSVDDPAIAREGAALARRLARERGVQGVASYWTSGPEGRRLRSADGRAALIEARLPGDENASSAAAKRLAPRYRGRQGAFVVGLTGTAPLIAATEDQVKRDLTKAEAIALPLTLLALFLVFGGLVAAALPLAIGVVSIVGTLLALRLISEVTPVSVFAVNLATALGLGLAIDYSLLIVGRYREELRRGAEPRMAVAATMATAGRTVLVSAVIVAISLAGLLVFPMYYLRSFAYAGVAVVAIAALGAMVLMPAMLAVIGHRIDALSLRRARVSARPAATGGWYRVARFTMRRPAPIATLGVLALLALGAPFLHAKLSLVDDRNLPTSASAHQVTNEVRAEFAVRDDGTLLVLARHAPAGAEVTEYAKLLSRLDGVTAVDAAPGTFADGRLVAPRPSTAGARYTRDGATWLAVQTRLEPVSPAAERLARAVRATPAPFAVEVAGMAAGSVDTKHAMATRLPFALLLIGVTTFVALFAMSGSVVAPIKALVLNALSLTAAFGALVYIFQDGHLRWLVGDFTLTGSIALLNPPLLFCVAFGLSMDYEVFMLSRIKEEHDRGRGDAEAIAVGLQRTGPVITAAAVVMAIVFVGFATSGVTGVKSIGVGLAIAVLVDATLVRVALVPAIMRLAGRWNWWAPLPLRWLHRQLGWAR